VIVYCCVKVILLLADSAGVLNFSGYTAACRVLVYCFVQDILLPADSAGALLC
jgi:hypothetical protein